MTLNLIPAGEFMMGSQDTDKDAAANEKPLHKVRISSFYLGIYEVTQDQYENVMGNNPSWCSPTGAGRHVVAGRSTGNYPVESVSWWDAVRFCNALSAKEGRTPYYAVHGDTVEIPKRKGPGYRLPTEAEWEHACRAGTAWTYSFGGDPSVLGKYAQFQENAKGCCRPVGQKRANGLGLFDMHGNVVEWCSDVFDADYYMKSLREDPLAAYESGERVFRGGDFNGSASECRSASRGAVKPELRHYRNGFRVARGQFPEVMNLAGSAESNTKPSLELKNTRVAKGGQAVASLTARSKPAPSSVKSKRIQKPLGDWKSTTTELTFVRIKGGEFMMGSTDGDKDATTSEMPALFTVRISPFYSGELPK